DESPHSRRATAGLSRTQSTPGSLAPGWPRGGSTANAQGARYAVRTSQPGQSALLFLDVAGILERENVAYAVIGAFALSAHGTVRGTMVVDAVLHTSPQQLANLRATFDRAGFQAELRRGDSDDP